MEEGCVLRLTKQSWRPVYKIEKSITFTINKFKINTNNNINELDQDPTAKYDEYN